MAAALTFQELRNIMLERVGREGLPGRASLPNLLSALDGFLSERGIPSEAAVGATLRLAYYRTRDEHLRNLEAQGRSKSYISNRKYFLSCWRKLVVALDKERAARTGEHTPLQKALHDVIAGGGTIKRLAREAGIPLSSLKRWLAGATPNAKGVVQLRKLERFLGMNVGALTDCIPSLHDRISRDTGSVTEAPKIEYRRRLRELCQQRYVLKAHTVLPEFQREWVELLKYKADVPSVRSLVSEKSDELPRWRLRKRDELEERPDSWVDTISGRWCPTASINFHHVASFIGWLQLDTKEGGRGWSAERAQTLANLCDEDSLAAFIDWRIERSGGVNGGPKILLLFVKMLCHPERGFLVARPDIGRRIGLDEVAWKERCSQVLQFVKKAEKKVKKLEEPSRDPFEPIEAILGLDNLSADIGN